MKYIFLSFLSFLYSNFIIAQDSLCFKESSGDYWPLNINNPLKYKSGKDSYVSSFKGDSIEFKGLHYLVETEVYKSGKTKTSYWREEKGAIYSFDKENGLESMELPSNPEIGFSWQSQDKIWTYKIASLTSSFSTPFCDFSNLLEVKTESSKREGTYYSLFYKKGIGMVGISINGNPYSYILPNKELNERSYVAYGCENLASENEIKKCTSSKIYKHIKDNLKLKGKVKKGRIIVNVILGKNGTVENVKILSGIKNAETQENQLVLVLKSLPQFIPAQVDDNRPVKSSFTIPVSF